MYGVRKRFNSKLHAGHDPKSREVVKAFLAKHGMMVEDNPDKFGVDLLSPDRTLQIEVEHRPPWDGEDFPFSEVNVPERKAKFLQEGKVQYIILSRDYSRLGIIRGEDVKPYIVDDNLALNKNKYVRNDEYFFKVPVEKFKWVLV